MTYTLGIRFVSSRNVIVSYNTESIVPTFTLNFLGANVAFSMIGYLSDFSTFPRVTGTNSFSLYTNPIPVNICT